MKKVRELEPNALWNNFADLNEVPRPSKKEEQVIKFLKNFGEKLQLETLVDEVGNVIIKKSATAGMENKKTVVLQGHMDMVPQKMLMLIMILKKMELTCMLMEIG